MYMLTWSQFSIDICVQPSWSHDAGAASVTEGVYGLTFGALYLATGGNLFAPIISHIIYDLATFIEVRAVASLLSLSLSMLIA